MEKSKAILQSLLPVVMWLAIQSVVSLVFLFWRDYPPYFDGVLIKFCDTAYRWILVSKSEKEGRYSSDCGFTNRVDRSCSFRGRNSVLHKLCTHRNFRSVSSGDGKLRRGYGKFGNVQPYLFLHSIYHAFSAFCRGIDFQRTDLKNIGKILSVLGCQYFTSIVFRNNTRQYYSVLLCLFRRFVIWRCNV